MFKIYEKTQIHICRLQLSKDLSDIDCRRDLNNIKDYT